MPLLENYSHMIEWVQNFLGVCETYQEKKKKKKKEWNVLCSCFWLDHLLHVCTNAHMCVCVLISPSHVPIDIIVFVTDNIIRAQQLEAPWK